MPSTGLGQGHAAPVAVEWECLSNFYGEDVFRARLALRNVSGRPIRPGWAVYFNTCRKVVPGSVTQGFVLEHVNGDLFRLVESGAPQAWRDGETRELRYAASFWAISHTDAPLGFYLLPADGGGAIDLGDPAIVPFTRAEQLHRHEGDLVRPADAAARFDDNLGLAPLPRDAVGRITPRPVFVQLHDAVCTLGGEAAIEHGPALAGEAALLRAMLAGVPSHKPGRVVLEVGDVEVPGVPASAEAYLLEAQPGMVRVRGATPHGVFNGIQTLWQLLDTETGELPLGRVLDAPRFPYRGMMLDVARHFADVETVMRLLDCMARYKLNRFHFHLTDDEGWRLAIDALPELTEVGARRGVDTAQQPCLPPSFGSGPDCGRAGGSGFYTADDFIAILRYAHARHIEVIPEFNLPGHARAAVVAMRVRHDRLVAQGQVDEAKRYLLSDPDDQSSYESVQLWHDNVICIALPSVDRFIDTVVAEVRALYRRAGVPLRTIHTGGDEVPAGAWLGSPLCRARMQENGWTDVARLREDFTARCRAILARHGLAFAGWDETALVRASEGTSLLPNPRLAGPDFHVYVWNNAWGSGQEDCAYRLANAGYSVVLSNAASLYFDLAYAKDPEEPGYYWAGFVETRDAFCFSPLDAAQSAGDDAMGRPLPATAVAAMERLDEGGRGRIQGLQGQLWGENARGRGRIEYLALPRMIALAERAWAPDPGWERAASEQERKAWIARDWNEFANRLGQRELPRLDRAPLPYAYRLPPPGAVLRDGAVHANVALPGLLMRYTLDGSEPHAGSACYGGPVEVATATRFTIATFDTRGRKSRSVTIDTGDNRHA